MKDFFQLVKAVQASSLVVNKKTKKGKKAKAVNMTLSLLLVSLMLNLCFVSEFYSFFGKTVGLDMQLSDYYSYILVALTSYSLFGFFMCLIFISTIFFKGDNDIFLSLPISGNRYFLAKYVLSLYITFIYGGLTILICSVMTCILLHLSFLSYLFGVLSAVIYIFAVPALCFLILNFLSGFIDFKSRSKSFFIFSAICGILSTFSALYLSSSTGIVPAEGGKDVIVSAMDAYASPFNWINWVGFLPTKSLLLMKGVDFLFFFAYLGIACLILLFALFFARRSYLSHLGKTFSSKKKQIPEKKRQKKFQKTISLLAHPEKIALRRELSLYKAERGILIEGFIMPAIMLATFGISLYSFKGTGMFSDRPEVFQALTCGMLLYAFYYYSIPSCALSLEGRNLVLMKTMPIEKKDFIFRKLYPSFLIYYPVSLMSAIFLFFAAPFDFSYLFSILLLTLTYPFMIILFSFYLGVRFPNPNYESIADLLKRKASAILSQVGHFIFFILESFVLITFAFFNCPLWIAAVICSAVNVLLAFLFFVLSKKRLAIYLDSEISL